MKKIKIMITIVILLTLISCGVETPNFECRGKETFIVGKIILNKDGTCMYVNKKYNNQIVQFFAWKSSFNAPKGLFQIGDTVKFEVKN